MEGKIERTKFNICLMGESHVGKTCIAYKLTEKVFNENTLTTIGVENFLKAYNIEGKNYTFKIFDTAGQERYRSFSTSTIRISDGFVVVFALDDKNSFECVNNWISSIQQNGDMSRKVVILVGNKIDLDKRVVTNEEALKFAQSKRIKYFEASAKTGYNIETIFEEMAKDVYNLNKKLESESENNNENPQEKKIILEEKKHSKKKSSCC